MTAPGTLLLDTITDLNDGLVVLNQTDGDGVEWFGDLVEGWYEAPGERLSLQDRPAGDGSYDSQSFLMARTVVIEGAVIAPTRELADSTLSRFNRVFAGGRLVPMVVTEPAGSFRLMVRKAAKVSLKRINSVSWTYQMSVIAPDPIKYSAELHTAQTGLAADAPGGIQWNGPAGTSGINWNSVVYQSGNGNNGVLTLVNAGSYPTPIRFTVSGASPPPSIVDTARDNVISYPDSIASGSALVIDTGTGYTALDGQNRRPQLTSADFFTIPAESSVDVTFRAPAASATALLTASWRDASY